ncbi:MAG TPA: YdiU family protein [Caulobacteraceae bacterium]|jgi:uncharacterized protein YdiU (UPF0061 family)|nr:YdiU family protein [Caulobacteraceae bacterium]
MPLAAAPRPDPVYQRLTQSLADGLGAEFADPVAPAVFPEPRLRFRNDRAAASVGLDTLTDAAWLAHFARFEPLPGNQTHPLAMRYHGHQFRSYNPDLGDGRGFLYAQLREAGTGRLLDLGTKGSGVTPWSRDGDGRLTLKGGVREALATAMLEALGVPTSRTFSLVETGEALQRSDEPSPTRGAVLVRLSFSHIRFGTFQRFAAYERADLIGALLDHVIETYAPHLKGEAAPAAAWLAHVTGLAARLTARWMAAGFVHGVLNTDNMNINGESFDYGPYRFLPRNDPNFVAAYFDHSGLYSFGRQPEAVFWNLRQLAGALTFVSPTEPLVEALNGFSARYRDELASAMTARLGLVAQGGEADVDLANAAFRALGEGGERLRWEPFFFDWFCGAASEGRAMAGPRAGLYDGEAFRAFRALLASRTPERPERLAHAWFTRPEPEELLYDQIEALWAPIAAADDWGPFDAKLAAIETARQAWALG